jgi:hypothetical protein
MSTNKLSQTNAESLLLAGTQKHFSNSASLPFGGSTHAPTEIETALQRRMTAAGATGTARTAFHSAVAAERQARAETSKFVQQFRAFVLATFGEDLNALADFGLAPRKTTVKPPVVKVAAAQKARATRQARGTKGKTQKKAIKGATTAPATPAGGATTVTAK